MYPFKPNVLCKLREFELHLGEESHPKVLIGGARPSSKVGRKGSGERGADLWGKSGLQMVATLKATNWVLAVGTKMELSPWRETVGQGWQISQAQT